MTKLPIIDLIAVRPPDDTEARPGRTIQCVCLVEEAGEGNGFVNRKAAIGITARNLVGRTIRRFTLKCPPISRN